METTQETRLILHKLVLENFKSYAGTVEIGPFDNSFSCIVGPNGSGKSNVIDAIQFVFGKSGTKLRLKKLSELIHNSAHFPNCDFARVTVYMHEIDTQEHILNEYTVARAVNKQSNTKYFLNNEKSSFTEITEFLLSKGIDLNFNRFLILQGEVEQIAQMKPKSPHSTGDVSQRETGLLEYIEDVIGTTKYVEPIEKQATEVETLTEQRQEKLNRVKVAEDEVNYLEDSKNEAEDFLKSRVKLFTMQKELTSQQAEGVQNDLTASEAKLQEYKQKDQKINEDIKQIESSNKGLFEEFKQMKQKLDKLDRQKKDTKEALEKFEVEDEKLTSELRFLGDNLNQKTKQISDNKSKIKTMTKDIEELKEEIEESQRELSEEINVELEKLEKKKEQLQKDTLKEIEPFRVEIENIKKNKLAAETKKLQELNARLQIEKEQLQIFTEKFSRVEKDLEEFKKQLSTVIAEIPQTSTKAKQHHTLNQQLLKRIPLLQKELLEHIEPAIISHETEIRKLKQKVQIAKESQSTSKTQSRLLTALLEQKAKGTLHGIYDRLGNLALIDAKYDVAISTAAKAALDMVVVKDSASGKACVEFLHKQQLGVASFILMDVVKRDKKKMLERMQQKSDSFPAPRLFDLIEFEEVSEDEKHDKERTEYLEDIKLAFYYGMRDTLVCDTLDKATQIAYNSVHKEKMYRIVTLNGELIESSGTMSGGGKQQFKGACNLTKRGRGSHASLANEFKEVKQDEEKIEKLEKVLVEMKEKKSNVQQQLEECTEQQKKIETELNKLVMDEKSLQKKQTQLIQKIKELEAQYQNQKSELDSDSKFQQQVTQMKNSITNIEFQIDEQTKKTESLQTQVQELQEKIDNAGGGSVKKIIAQLSDLQQKQKELEQTITKKQVQFDSSSKKLKRATQTVETLEAEITQTQEKIDLRQKEHKELESKAETVLVECAKADEEFKTFKREYEEKESMYSKEKEKIEEFKKELSEIYSKIAETEKVTVELSKKYKYFNDKVMNLDRQIQSIISEYSLENIDVESLSSMEIEDLKHEILVLEEKLKKLNNNVNLVAIIQYRSKNAEFEGKKAELEAVTNERNNAQKQLEDLRKKRLDEFMTGFTNITMKLKEIYQMITLGGDAELELVDSLDPFSEGIVFSVRPPKKSWKNIAHLSGGEKTLSSLALVFALHTFKPTPIYMMDEIDAALDFKNVSIVANYIKEKTKNCAQFIVISLRNNMFELADMLVGIYKTNFTTKSITVNPHLVSVKPIHNNNSTVSTKNASTIPTQANNRVPLASLSTNL